MKKIFSKHKGKIAQLLVELEAAKKNLTVSVPTTENCIYDLIFHDGKTLSKVQIKYCGKKTNKERPNSIQLRLASTNTNSLQGARPYYTKEDIDLLLVYVPKIDTILKYGPELFHKKTYLEINLENPDSKYYWKKHIWK